MYWRIRRTKNFFTGIYYIKSNDDDFTLELALELEREGYLVDIDLVSDEEYKIKLYK